MAWPSGSKAGTTSTDNASDSISGARADINQNITNVNSIIDLFNIGTPGASEDNKILVFDNSTGKFEVEANAAGSTTINNNADNRIITGSGSANTLNGESTLLYDGTSLSNTTAPTFTEASTPIQLNGTIPNQGGYYVHTSINSQTSRGGIGYRSRTAGGTTIDTHTLFFDLDNDFSARPTGAFQGDRNVWFQANHGGDTLSMFMDGFSTNTIESYDGNNDSYARTPLELHGSTTTLKAGGSTVLTVASSGVTIGEDLIIGAAGENDVLHINTNLQLTENAITATPSGSDPFEIKSAKGLRLHVDSNNSGNESMEFQSGSTTFMTIQEGPGGDAELSVKGDGFFIKDDQDDVQFSMDMSSASQTGINVFRTNENKSLNFALKTDDDDDTGNFDGTWSFRQDANKKKMEFERTDSGTVTIFEVRDSADVATADPTDIFDFKIPVVLPSFTVANLPTTVVAGAQAFCTNDTGGAVNVFYDGSAWRRCTDRNVAST